MMIWLTYKTFYTLMILQAESNLLEARAPISV